MTDASMTELGEADGRPRWPALFGAGAGIVGLVAVLATGSVELVFPGGLAGPSSRLEVSGVVLFDGRPIASGEVELVPQMIPCEEPAFTPGRADIRDGWFCLPEHAGVCPGHYLLRVRSAVVETRTTAVPEDVLRQRPTAEVPCERRAPIIVVKRGVQNHFVIRFE